MYYPYLRGRQNEVLALKTLAEEGLLSERIIPVLEPVNMSASLLRMLRTFSERQQRIVVVCNPKVGAVNKELWEELEDSIKQEYTEYINNGNVTKALIVSNKLAADIQLCNDTFAMHLKKEEAILVGNTPELYGIYEKEYGVANAKVILMPENIGLRRKMQKRRQAVVMLADRFNRKGSNADYNNPDDEFFSEDHLYYEEEGYAGFSDYSIIGADYIESGFAPRAVTIHLVYLDKADDSLRVHHCVSITNEGYKDPAQKYGEALEKLVQFCEKNGVHETMGLAIFKQHYKDGAYPGFGMIKRLSLMHHFEIMGKYLDQRG